MNGTMLDDMPGWLAAALFVGLLVALWWKWGTK